MLLSGPFENFVEASPVSVTMRGIIENLFHPERLAGLVKYYYRDLGHVGNVACKSLFALLTFRNLQQCQLRSNVDK